MDEVGEAIGILAGWEKGSQDDRKPGLTMVSVDRANNKLSYISNFNNLVLLSGSKNASIRE